MKHIENTGIVYLVECKWQSLLLRNFVENIFQVRGIDWLVVHIILMFIRMIADCVARQTNNSKMPFA